MRQLSQGFFQGKPKESFVLRLENVIQATIFLCQLVGALGGLQSHIFKTVSFLLRFLVMCRRRRPREKGGLFSCVCVKGELGVTEGLFKDCQISVNGCCKHAGKSVNVVKKMKGDLSWTAKKSLACEIKIFRRF